MIDIVCYNGGACGDIITAMIDPRGSTISNKVWLFSDRSLLKKTHLFPNDDARDRYVTRMSHYWKSIPSHDLEYHVRKGHDFIGITVEDWDTALWAATRFKKLHRPQVWQEMVKRCGVQDVPGYAQMMRDFSSLIKTKTQRIIQLERIVSGHVAEDLVALTGRTDEGVYRSWMYQLGLPL